MLSRDEVQDNLCKSLGREYFVDVVELERCICRDFGNGFAVEISQTHVADEFANASIYLWCALDGDPFIVKNIRDVPRKAIHAVVEELYRQSEQLISRGYITRSRLYKLKSVYHYNERIGRLLGAE